MSEEHVSNDVLDLYAHCPEKLPDRAPIAMHLAECTRCTSTLQEIHEFDRLLADPDTWTGIDDLPEQRERLGELRAFHARSAAEDREAEALLAQHQEISPLLLDDARLRTGGMVRALCRHANRTCERNPLTALAVAEMAIAIASALDPADFPRGSVHVLRGDAWKEQANALRFLGRLPETLRALDHADAEYGRLPAPGIGPVAVQYIRAIVLYEQEQLDAAEALVAKAERGALHLGDVDRAMRARHIRGSILYERGDFAGAAEQFLRVYEHGRAVNDPIWLAREALTLGNCSIETGELGAARRQLDEALALFTTLGFAPEVTRTRWALGRLEMREGKPHEAVVTLRESLAELTRYDMMTDAGLVAVDLAEMLDATARTEEIPLLLAGVVETFTRNGKLNGAMSALAYLRTAAMSKSITPALVGEVRRFIVRSERQPELLFAPTPEPL